MRWLQPSVAAVRRWMAARSRPTGVENAQRLRERGETLDRIVLRDAVEADLPALAELHVELWNRTYRTERGPGVALRLRQWNEKLARVPRQDFLLLLENPGGRLIGFTWGLPHNGTFAQGQFAGELNKIYLRWEYHGLGLGRRMMAEAARQFLARDIASCILFADLANPTIGFYDRLGGERLRDDRGRFNGAFGWRDVRVLLTGRSDG